MDAPPPYRPGEFELFVQRQAGGASVRRFGAEVVAGDYDGMSDGSPAVPSDYLVGPGDEVLVTIWGSVDADLNLIVDRTGRISIPRVGTIQVAGVRQSELQELISRRVGLLFKNFQISVAMGRLRSIRVFVTGFAARPGSYTLSGLASMTNALMKAGGPSAAGSFRQIELRRDNKLLAELDFYDLLLRGQREADRVLQAGDVIHIRAIGPQVGVIGSVNHAGVFELKSNETIADAVQMAGGFSAVADRSRMTVERIEDRDTVRVVQLDLPASGSAPLRSGDVLRAFSAVEVALPVERQAKRVRVEGEVQRPAEYILPPGGSLADAIRAAGGLTSSAFPYATEFTRASVRESQRENYQRALRDLETEISRNQASRRGTSVEEEAAMGRRSAATASLLERLRGLEPSGRLILQMSPGANELPNIALEDGDRIYVPARSTTVGVFGSVFNAATYLYGPGRVLDDYLRLAGGPTKGADADSVFVVRANGTVVSSQQTGGGSWFSRNTFGSLTAEPGDTMFVPEDLYKTSFLQSTKDWTLLLYQLGVGLAGLKSAFR